MSPKQYERDPDGHARRAKANHDEEPSAILRVKSTARANTFPSAAESKSKSPRVASSRADRGFKIRDSLRVTCLSIRLTALAAAMAVGACSGDNDAGLPASVASGGISPSGVGAPTPPSQAAHPPVAPAPAAPVGPSDPTEPSEAVTPSAPVAPPGNAPVAPPDGVTPPSPAPTQAPAVPVDMVPSTPSPTPVATSPEPPAPTTPNPVPDPPTPVPVTVPPAPVAPACPAPPPTPQYGTWAPHFAEAAYPSEHDAVQDFKSLMVTQPVFDETGIALPWNLHSPSQAATDPDARFPLVVYLHGGAEVGTDPSQPGVHLNNRHMKNFFASANSLLTDEFQERFPAYIVAPSCNCSFFNNEWSSNGGANFVMKENPSEYGGAVLALVEKLIAEKSIDPARIYVTGTSMGGGGSWEFAVRRPDLFAAAIPLSGHPPSRQDLDRLIESKVAVWSNHGQGDGNNPHGDAVEAVRYVSEGGGCAWIASYPEGQPSDDPADADPSDVKHNVWARAYTNPELWPWLFSVSRPR